MLEHEYLFFAEPGSAAAATAVRTDDDPLDADDDLSPERDGFPAAAASPTFQRVHGSGDGAAGRASGGVAIYENVILQIKSLLREGKYRPGDRLPSERELAQELGVNRNALREAIRALTLMGVIQTRPQSGSHLSATVDGMLRLPFEFLMLMLRPSYEQIHELRSLIELYSVERAAERRTEADLAKLDGLLDELRRCGGLVPSGEWNVRFHRAVAGATQNPLIEHVQNCLLEARSRYIRANRPSRGGRESIENHERIVEAIRECRPADARRAMEEDMATATRVGRKIPAQAPSAAE